MKKIVIALGLLIATLLSAQEPYLLVGGSGWKQIAIIEKESANILWSHELGDGEENNSVAVTPKGDILYSYKHGAKLINLKHEVLWDYRSPKGAELFTASLLPDGGFLLGYCGHPARIIELNAKGVVTSEVVFEIGISTEHDQFRQAIKSKRGTYLVPLMGKGVVIELTMQGEEISRWEAKGNPFAVLELENGNLIVSCGDAHAYVEIERESGKMVREVNNATIAASMHEFNFVAHIKQLAHTLLVCNWNGHMKGTQTVQPSILEIDSANQVVWKLKANPEIGRISSVAVYPSTRQLKKIINQSNKL